MTVLRSILILVASVLLILVPYAWGHALSTQHSTPWIVGIVALVLAVAVSFALSRRRPGSDQRVHH